MRENIVITDVTQIMTINLSSKETILKYLSDRPSLHVLVSEQGDVYFVKNDNVRLFVQLTRRLMVFIVHPLPVSPMAGLI